MVIVITGPIASGKSTVAKELARSLDADGIRTAVIDLDLVHQELIATGSTADESIWAQARHRAAEAANAFSRDGVAVVIAEGSFNLPTDRAAFDEDLVGHSGPVYVTLQVSFAEALRRAQGDSTRGRSRDPVFLASYFTKWREALADLPATDLVIETERTTVEAAAATIARLIPGPASRA
jgi:adenylylsulfate kinase-like enzyme